MKDFRKLFADSVIQTTHLFKKLVCIPIKYDEESNLEEVKDAYTPFMRGVMEFDDFNYAIHNPYVLVEDPKYAVAEAQPKKDEPAMLSTHRSGVSMAGPSPSAARGGPSAQEPAMDPAFSQKNVNSSVTEEYEHPVVTIQPSEMELEKAEAARQAAIAEEEAAKEKARKEAEKLKRKGSASKTSKEEL